MPNILDAFHYSYNPYAFPPILAGTLCGILALLTGIQRRLSAVRWSFTFLAFCGTIWMLSYGGIYSTSNPEVATAWCRIENAAVVFIPTALYLFTLLATRRFKQGWWLLLGAFTLSFFFLWQVLATDSFIAGVYVYPWGYYARYGPATVPFLIFFAVIMGTSLALFWHDHRKAPPGVHKRRLNIFFISFSAAALGSVDFLPAFGLKVYPGGYVALIAFILIAAYGQWRYRLLTIDTTFASKYILDHMADALFIVDRDGIIRFANPSACQVFGSSQRNLQGMMITKLEGFCSRENLNALFLRGASKSYEVRIRRGAAYSFLNVLASVMRDGTGEPAAVIFIARDITANKQAEAKVSQSQAERDHMELFTYIASHDLQEPLQKIVIFGDLLKDRSAAVLDEKGKEYIDRIQGAAMRLSQLINDLLKFSRVTTRREPFQDVDLGDVLKEVLTDLELRISECGARILADPLPTLKADRLQIGQLFQNLIGNAIKFQKRGDSPEIRISYQMSTPGWVDIRIKDNGIGFEQSDADRIFKPFERLHGRSEYEGSGMGLAICQKIVLHHGGNISVKSEPGGGAEFFIRLPVGQPVPVESGI